MKEQFSFTGRVIEGHHLGHTLGFPTANIVVTPGERVPAFGVYAAWVTLPDGTRHAAVTNLGVRPTVEEAGALWVESYLLDFSGDLYGQELTVTLCHFLRPERRFPNVEALRQAIAAHLRQFRAMEVTAEQIIVGAGTEVLYNLLVQLLGRDRLYGVEDPGYGKIAHIYRAAGAEVTALPLDEAGVSVEALRRSDADVVHISPSHHYPTGLVMPIARRQELLRWAQEVPARVILEDDYDSEFRFVGRPIPTLFSIDGGEQVVYLNTFSKTIAPSIRISFMVLPRRLLADFRQKLGFYACTVSAFEQYTLAQFLAGGWYEKHLSRMRKHYRQKRDAVIAAVYKSPLAPYAAITEEDAGLHFLLRLDGAPDETLRREAEQRGIRLAMLSDYYQCPQDAPQHVLVVNYTGIDLDRLPAALERLAALWKENDHV